MAKRYQLGRGRRVTNVVIGGLLRLGIPAPQKTSYLLTTRGRRTGVQRVVAEELDAELAGPILRHYVRQVRITAPFFDADANAPVQDFVAEAARHPVFRLKPPG